MSAGLPKQIHLNYTNDVKRSTDNRGLVPLGSVGPFASRGVIDAAWHETAHRDEERHTRVLLRIAHAVNSQS